MSFPRCCHTTLINRTELGKFGLFFMFLITADSTICPPHSIIRLGEDTAASWYGFMFLRPHARICTHIEDVLKHMACLPSDQLWGSGFLPLESMETQFYWKQCKYIKLKWSEVKWSEVSVLPPQQWAEPQAECPAEPYRGSRLFLEEPEEDLLHPPTERESAGSCSNQICNEIKTIRCPY